MCRERETRGGGGRGSSQLWGHPSQDLQTSWSTDEPFPLCLVPIPDHRLMSKINDFFVIRH